MTLMCPDARGSAELEAAKSLFSFPRPRPSGVSVENTAARAGPMAGAHVVDGVASG
jgi:hypothetical protein